jgi:outer membrane protein OmpA-like peptidoglycan-associated protein
MKILIGLFFSFSLSSMLSQEHRNTLIIYYGFNEFELSNTAQKQLESLLETARKGEFYIENVTAYTDLNGDFQYNKNLAEKRIKSVEKLIKSYNFEIIKKNAAGENYPKNALNTDDYKYWRRVEIQYLIVPPTLVIPDEPQSQTETDFNIEKISSLNKSSIVLNIEFIPGEDVLIGNSFEEINKLYTFLSDNPQVYAFLRGHVCCADDFALSSARAHAVFLKLVQKGIDAKRLRYDGFSNYIPVVTPELTDEDRQKNRRVDVIFTIN